MMGQLGEYAKPEIGFGSGGGESSRERSFSYGANSEFMGRSGNGNMESGPSNRKSQGSNNGQSASGSTSATAKRGSKACVACELTSV